MPIVGDAQILQLGVVARRHDLQRSRRLAAARRRQAQPCQGDAVAVAVRAQVNRRAVGREPGLAEAGGRLMRRQQSFAARLQIDGIDVVVAALAHPLDQGGSAVAADVGDRAVAAAGRHKAPRAGSQIVGEGIERSRIGAVRRQQQLAAVAAPAVQDVVRLAAVAGAHQLFAVGAHQVDLRVHAAARRQAERQPVAIRRPLDAAHRIVEAGHLLRPAAVGRHHPHLRHTAEVRHEGEPQPIGREARRPAAAHSRHPRHLCLEHGVARRGRRSRRGRRGRRGKRARGGPPGQQREGRDREG